MSVDASLREVAIHERDHPRPSIVSAIGALGLTAGMRVADIGCGPGAHLHLFTNHVGPDGTIVGVDIDEERLRLAEEINGALVDRGIVETRQGDVAQLPFDDGTFDVTWSSLVLHHREEPLDLVSEMARITRGGGKVAIMEGDNGGSFPLLPWPPELEQRLRAAQLRREQDRLGGHDTLPYHFSGYTGRGLTRLFHEAGLSDVTLHAFSDVTQPPLDPLREREIRSWFLDSLGERLRPYLAPLDWERYNSCFDSGSPDDLLGTPSFFMVRTWYLYLGTPR